MNKETIDKLIKHSQIITKSQFYIAAAEYKADKLLSRLVIRRFTDDEKKVYSNVNTIQENHQRKWQSIVDEHFELMDSLDDEERKSIESEGIDKYLKKNYNIDVPRFTVEDQIKTSQKVFGEIVTFQTLMREGYMNNDVLFGHRREQRDHKLENIEKKFMGA